mgnify:CR=1 FL=1
MMSDGVVLGLAGGRWSIWTGWRSRSASGGWRRGGGTCTREPSSASGLSTGDTVTAAKMKKRAVATVKFRMCICMVILTTVYSIISKVKLGLSLILGP